MSDEPRLLYLEPDDEITSVVRRLAETDARKVVVVVPGRSRATSSLVALRLLARAAAAGGRDLTMVADPATRALAGDAGIPAYATLADAISGSPAPAVASSRAPIRVVRGVSEPPPQALPGVPAPRSIGDDETVAVRLPTRPGGEPRTRLGGGPRGRRRHPLGRWVVAALFVVVAGSGAALVPGATITVTPITAAVGPLNYSLTVEVAGHETGTVTALVSGTPTGERVELVPAIGSVTFSNWNLVSVEVPAGTPVSVGGGVAFVTDARLVVPAGSVSGTTLVPSRRSVTVTAIVAGGSGNVSAETIDTIDDRAIRARLRGSPSNKNRLVTNPEATAGGAETTHPVVQQIDVDAALASAQAALSRELADRLASSNPDQVFADPGAGEAPIVVVPDGLVGTEDVTTFDLSGSLGYDRVYAQRADIQQAAEERLAGDPAAAPPGMTIAPTSLRVTVVSIAVSGQQLTAQVTVDGVAAATIDEGAVRDRVAGLSADEARTALAELGTIAIRLWPEWVAEVPRIGWRISVETALPAEQAP